MKIRPINDHVLLLPRDNFRGSKTIALPEAYDDDAHGSNNDFIRETNQLALATVLAVGKGWQFEVGRRLGNDVKPGDSVLYNRADGKELIQDGQQLVIIRNHAIFCVVPNDVEAEFGGIVSTHEPDDN